jgi:HAD superfamily hydrolase (TIGR01509 family)
MKAEGLSIKTVIYDCDGVMFDSIDANFAFYERIMAPLGLTLDRQDETTMRVLHTYANRDVLSFFFPEEPEKSRALDLAAAIDYRDLVPLMRMEGGFVETLEALQPRFHLAVCTNRSISMEAVLLEFDLARFFSCVMTAAQVRNPKPHPDPLYRVLEHYRIAPHEALFVGDSEVDRQAAVAAGIPFVAYKADLPGFARIDHHGEILSLLETETTRRPL